MSKLNLSKDLSLPAEEIAESAIGLIAKRGRGKSGVLKILMEEMAAVGVPFVMFDPVGIAYGLRSSFDGKTASGIKVLVVGGPHADVRLERRAGAAVAQAIVQANISAIIDFSEEPKSVYREFVRDFALEIFKINDGPRLIILEEAPELVPQRLRPDMTATFDAVERLVSRGRNKGLGVVLVSQRSATINKDVLTQVDVMIVMGLTSPQDRAALKEWVEAKAEKDKLKEFDEGLAGLQRQEGWVWSPEAFGGIFRKVRFRDFRTFHPDKTHLRRQGLLQVKPVTTDVSAIVDKLGAAVARISKEKTAIVDNKKAEGRIRELEREVEKLRARPPAAPKTEVKRVEVPVVKDAQVRRVEQLMEKAHAVSQNLSVEVGRLAAAIAGAQRQGGAQAAYPGTPRPKPTLAQSPGRGVILEPRKAAPRALPHAAVADDNGNSWLTKPAPRNMLKTLVGRHPTRLTRSQVGMLSGYSPASSQFAPSLRALADAGFTDQDANGRLGVTPAGFEWVGESRSSTPATPEQLQSMWLSKLPKAAAKMLEVLIEAFPNGVPNEVLAERSGYSMNSSQFRPTINTLRDNGVVEDGDMGLRASPTLFGE